MTDRELAGCALSEVMALLEKATPGELMYVPDYGWNIASDTFSPKSRTAGSVGTAIRPQDAQAICASVNFLRQHGLALLAALSTPSSEGDGRDAERLDWLCAVDPARRVEGRMGFRAYEDVAPLDVEHSHWVALTDRFYGTAREAIDAAMEKERGT